MESVKEKGDEIMFNDW